MMMSRSQSNSFDVAGEVERSDGPYQVTCPVCGDVTCVQSESTARLTVEMHETDSTCAHRDINCKYHEVER